MKQRILTLCCAALACGLSSCISQLTSIEREADGTYVLTGFEDRGLLFGGPRAYVLTATHDPGTNTLVIVEEEAQPLTLGR